MFYQKSHNGVHGHIGLPVARVVEVEYNTGKDSVFLQNVHTLILKITSVMDLSMKKGSAMNSVAMVRSQLATSSADSAEYQNKVYTGIIYIEKPHWGVWKDWSACSRSCGGGLTYRRRECYHSKCPHPYYKSCYGNSYERKRCNEQCCPSKKQLTLHYTSYNDKLYDLQKSHTGVHGVIGLLAVNHVEEVYPSERDTATNLHVYILFIRIVLEMIMKRRNVMTDVAQVR